MKGLYIPGAVILGNPGSSSGGADLSDIDFTASKLDSRVSYSCASSHAYIAEDGTIQYAAANEWPLEYRDGVAVGRHEPEPQATNYNPYVMTLNTQSTIVGSQFDYYALPLFNCDFPAGKDKFIECMASVSGVGTFTLSHYALQASIAGNTAVSRPISYGMTTELDRRMAVNLETGTTSVERGTFVRTAAMAFHDAWRCICVINTDANLTQLAQRLMVASPVATIAATQQIIGMPQIESGNFATSPILTNRSAATRAQAFASIKNPGGIATSARVHYSDGETAMFDFDGAAEINIPVSGTDWGTRYITKCEYMKF